MGAVETFYAKRGGAKLKGEKLVKKLKAREKTSREWSGLGEDIYLPAHVPVAVLTPIPSKSVIAAARQLKYYYVFNEHHRGPDGEVPISLANHCDERTRYRSFFHFLDQQLIELRGKLRRAGIDPDVVETDTDAEHLEDLWRSVSEELEKAPGNFGMALLAARIHLRRNDAAAARKLIEGRGLLETARQIKDPGIWVAQVEGLLKEAHCR
jgi:hypothetical protein